VLGSGESAESLSDYAERLRGWDGLDRAARTRLVAEGLRLCATVQQELPAHDSPQRAARPVDQPSGPGSPLTVLRGVGPALARRLATRGLQTVEDLLYLLPLGYRDRREVVPLGALQEGRQQTTRGVVVSIRQRSGRRGRMLELGLAERPGGRARLRAVWFRGWPGLAESFTRGQALLLSGPVRSYKGQLQMPHPDVTPAGDDAATAGIRCRYPEVQGVAPGRLERLCAQACQRFAGEVQDGIPAALARRLELPDQAGALRTLHLAGPEPTAEELSLLQRGEHPANRRLVFDELFSLQLAVVRRRQRWGALRAPACPPDPQAQQRLLSCLPFQLTAAQGRVLEEIRRDMARDRPMHRLLQGDVGSGKTAVAFGAAWAAMSAGLQAAIMAPTEILARQHLEVLEPWCEALGRRAFLLTAATPRAARESLLALADAGQVDLLVGTHALLAARLQMPNLGLAVVDEQHRFGVMQRARLRQRGGDPRQVLPHLLVMTATPIPRSMALTLYGDLDLSLLDEKPPGRRPPRTRVHLGEEREQAYRLVRQQLGLGQQVFVVCPLVEESEKLAVADATGTAEALRARFSDHRVGLVHGRLPPRQRHAVMDAFRRRELDLLVATTVIEVGIDVPRANVMLVENADRFGLAQLHQLRGRVGRGTEQSFCLLLSETAPTSDAGQRLAVMARTDDGFEIAEADLELRGPGELVGTRQSGVPRFRFAHLVRHRELLVAARQAAQELLDTDPELEAPEHRAARQVMERRWRHLPLVGEEAG
jgi:ATP-dependent DNA helicase RecG